MKIKTSELTDLALDWAVARALGKRPSMFVFQQTGALSAEHSYSTCWAQGGPIIGQEITRLDLVSDLEGVQKWNARRAKYLPDEGAKVDEQYGPTALIAICRCYVASLLGDEVDVPEELLCTSPTTSSAS